MTSHKVQKKSSKGFWLLNLLLMVISVEMAVIADMDPEKVGRALGIVIVLWFCILIAVLVTAWALRLLMR